MGIKNVLIVAELEELAVTKSDVAAALLTESALMNPATRSFDAGEYYEILVRANALNEGGVGVGSLPARALRVDLVGELEERHLSRNRTAYRFDAGYLNRGMSSW